MGSNDDDQSNMGMLINDREHDNSIVETGLNMVETGFNLTNNHMIL